MTEFTQPEIETRKIVTAFLIALSVGILLLLIAVLPAEYGIDPLGAGKVFGFSKLYQPDKPTALATETQTSFPRRTVRHVAPSSDRSIA